MHLRSRVGAVRGKLKAQVRNCYLTLRLRESKISSVFIMCEKKESMWSARRYKESM